jgi:hypothetical protein
MLSSDVFISKAGQVRKFTSAVAWHGKGFRRAASVFAPR